MPPIPPLLQYNYKELIKLTKVEYDSHLKEIVRQTNFNIIPQPDTLKKYVPFWGSVFAPPQLALEYGGKKQDLD